MSKFNTNDRVRVMHGAGEASNKYGVIVDKKNAKEYNIKLDKSNKIVSVDRNRIMKEEDMTIMDLAKHIVETETIGNMRLHNRTKQALAETLDDPSAIENYSPKIQDFVKETLMMENSAKRKSLLRKMGVASEKELSPQERKEFKKALGEAFNNFYDCYGLEIHELDEELSDKQKEKREEIVIKLKKRKEEFQKRYGDKWKEVMYATATKMVTDGKKEKDTVNEAALSFVQFNKTVDSLKKTGAKIKDVKFTPKKATYTMTNYETGKVMKFTYFDDGKLSIRQVGEVDVEEPKNSKKGRGRPKGSASGARHDTSAKGEKAGMTTHSLHLPGKGYSE